MPAQINRNFYNPFQPPEKQENIHYIYVAAFISSGDKRPLKYPIIVPALRFRMFHKNGFVYDIRKITQNALEYKLSGWFLSKYFKER